MVSSNELRENIFVVIDGQICKLDQDALEVIFAVRNFFELVPIPITADILEKCGFELKNENDFFPYYRIKHTRPNALVEYKFDISTRGDDEWRWIDGNANVPMYYLHQLQNLYFALTSSELPIKF